MYLVKQVLILFVFIYSIVHATFISAVELGAFGQRIFEFQQKLANGGNTLAQYKLGTMYEIGISVKPNLDEAKIWYLKAANKGHTPAINRLTYLDIKQNGFDEARHSSWLQNVTKDVELSEPNALILYGQMHRYGIAVDKNLNKAVGLLHKASSLGHTEIDYEIDEIKREIATNRAKRKQAKKAELAEKAKQAEQAKQAKLKQAAAQKKISKKKDAQKIREAKRRKFEEALRKQREEEKLLQSQQDWAESE